ncbi:MAG TPA: DUF4124 domain-containing protein [Usitatibacter sp.]|nr:DUF4124 domain-containing protein [Usitatibacter sp.]
MRILARIWIAAAGLLASDALAQEAFRCSAPDGHVTYQQTPCPTSNEQRKVDVTPANTTVDPGKRDEILKKGDEAGKRLEARAAADEAERKRRAAERERDEQRERETQAQEESREVYATPYGRYPRYPWPVPPNPNPRPPRPVPAPVGR